MEKKSKSVWIDIKERKPPMNKLLMFYEKEDGDIYLGWMEEFKDNWAFEYEMEVLKQLGEEMPEHIVVLRGGGYVPCDTITHWRHMPYGPKKKL